MEEIREFLVANHKNFVYYVDPNHPHCRQALSAWANDAEYQLDIGNPPSIELKASDSLHGIVEEFTVSKIGITTVEIESDYEE